MSKEMDFFIYLLEQYASFKGRSAADVFTEWKRHDLVDFIYSMYEMYHSEALENAFTDIDSCLETGHPAW